MNTEPDTHDRELSLDMASEKDRAMVRNQLKRFRKTGERRWAGLTDNVKSTLVSALVQATEVAVRHLDCMDALEAAKTVASCVKTGVMIDQLNHAVEVNEEKNERLDAGLTTENFGVRILKPDRMR